MQPDTDHERHSKQLARERERHGKQPEQKRDGKQPEQEREQHGKQVERERRGKQSEQTWHGKRSERDDRVGQDESVDLAFTALADPTRRKVLYDLAQGRPLSASALAADLPVSRQAVAQHLLVLQQAGLVESRRAGREVLFSVRPEGLTRTASWMTTLAETWSERLRMLKKVAETASASGSGSVEGSGSSSDLR
jgi:DNA-binding transcriptional ArsR family regulator